MSALKEIFDYPLDKDGLFADMVKPSVKGVVLPTVGPSPFEKRLLGYQIKAGITEERRDKLGRRRCYRDGKLVECRQGAQPAQPAAVAQLQPAANRPSKPNERCKDCEPPMLPFQPPPLPQGKKGGGKPERGVGERSQTMLGDKIEELSAQLGLRSILPEGQRSHRPGEVAEKGSTIDREWDSSGWAFEVKMCRTSATEYKAKPKKEELEGKAKFAEIHKLKPAMMIAVMDEEARTVQFYWRPGLGSWGLNPATAEAQGWRFMGAVTY